eukprot:TRINITY_DN3241_c0_g1_i2.p1 TRINITY_DN3241_c0_g1~~TRINITY_DN3241_c0_g1_i2.p1  ORF type:complete len:511 (+),score=130.00 TRINITY_DN3241_c0_g1_i2:144-1676(+)
MAPASGETQLGSAASAPQLGEKLGRAAAFLKNSVAERWQWQGRTGWKCFSDSESLKIQHAFVTNRKNMVMWDEGVMRELDFQNMRTLPGRQPLRYQLPPPPPTDHKSRALAELQQQKAVEEAEAADMARNRALTLTDMEKRRRVWEKLQADDRAREERAKANPPPVVMPLGFRSFVHPMFMELSHPRFVYGEFGDYEEFIWKRKLENCKDSTDTVCNIGEIYAEIFKHQDQPMIPVLGNPVQTMAAIALGFVLSGVDAAEDLRFAAAGVNGSRPSSSSRPLTGDLGGPGGAGRNNISSASGALRNLLADRPGSRPGSLLDTSAAARPASRSSGVLDITSASKQSIVRPSGQVMLPGLWGADLKETMGERMRGKSSKEPDKRGCLTFKMKDTPTNRQLSLHYINMWREWKKHTESARTLERHPFPKIDEGYEYFISTFSPEAKLTKLSCACRSIMYAMDLNRRFPTHISSRVSSLSALRAPKERPPGAHLKCKCHVEKGQSAIDIAVRLSS